MLLNYPNMFDSIVILNNGTFCTIKAFVEFIYCVFFVIYYLYFG